VRVGLNNAITASFISLWIAQANYMRSKFDINLAANTAKVREIYKKLPINK